MRDHQVLPDPLFSAPCGTAGGSNDGAVDTPQVLVDLSHVHFGGQQPVEDLVECSVVVPSVEQIPYRTPWAVLLRQITPWRAGPQDPEDAIHDHPPVAGWSPGFRPRRKYVLDEFPLIIRKSMSRHLYALRGKVKWSTQSMRQIPLATEDQFSDKALVLCPV